MNKIYLFIFWRGTKENVREQILLWYETNIIMFLSTRAKICYMFSSPGLFSTFFGTQYLNPNAITSHFFFFLILRVFISFTSLSCCKGLDVRLEIIILAVFSLAKWMVLQERNKGDWNENLGYLSKGMVYYWFLFNSFFNYVSINRN